MDRLYLVPPWEKSLLPSWNHRQHPDKFFLDHLCKTCYSVCAERRFDVLSPEPIDSPCLEPRGRGTSERFIVLICSPPLVCMTSGKLLNLSKPHSPYLQKKPMLLHSPEKSLSGLNEAINTRFKALGAKNIVVEGLWDTSGSWVHTTHIAPRCVSLNVCHGPWEWESRTQT